MIDRKKQIEEAAKQFERDYQSNGLGFQLGAQWADVTPPPNNMPRKHELDSLSKELDSLVSSGNPPAPSGDDERDAEAFAKTLPPFWLPDTAGASGFLAGRKGMVPASKVELLTLKLKKAEESEKELLMLSKLHCDQKVAEAVKSERERCARIFDLYSIGTTVDDHKQAVQEILNPPQETDGA